MIVFVGFLVVMIILGLFLRDKYVDGGQIDPSLYNGELMIALIVYSDGEKELIQVWYDKIDNLFWDEHGTMYLPNEIKINKKYAKR